MKGDSRPVLRAVESILAPDRKMGRVLILRDTQGIAGGQAVIPEVLIPVVARFDGTLTCEEIAREASQQVRAPIPSDVVVDLAEQLEKGLFLEGPEFRAARTGIVREFAASAVRPASHAGGAYHGDRAALERYLDESCLARASVEPAAAASGRSHMVGLVAPHIDPWRGALAYGKAYAALQSALSAEADTFVLFGTSHAPMREPFALCRKAFDTPLGPVDADTAMLDALASYARGFDPYADQFNHKREHSLEFQVVFLKHLLKNRPFRIVPILAGLGAHQSRGDDPSRAATIAPFMDGLRRLVEATPGRVVVVAGADLAHVGPRFGDAQAYDAEHRAALEAQDRASLEHAAALEPHAFWAHVAGDLHKRRVCGLAPIWSLLSTLAPSGRDGRILHYEQTVDHGDGSIVSHAAVGFYA